MKKIILIVSLMLTFGTQLTAQENINLLDKNGKNHGVWKKKHSNGHLRYEGQFEHGKETGVFKFYAVTGQKHPIAIKEYFADIDSISVAYFNLSGKLESKGKMISKDRVGIWNYYFPDGKTLMSQETYKANKLNGERKIFYKNGLLTEISNYVDGKLNGNRKRFGDDGKVTEDMTYDMGIVNGPAVIYDENGEVYARGNYEKGLKTGIWEFKIDGKWIKTDKPEKIKSKK